MLPRTLRIAAIFSDVVAVITRFLPFDDAVAAFGPVLDVARAARGSGPGAEDPSCKTESKVVTGHLAREFITLTQANARTRIGIPVRPGKGTQSAWLYETLRPHADDTVVTVTKRKQGCKDDERDAFDLANKVGSDSLEVKVYKEVDRYGLLRELVRAHQMQVDDSVRIQNRIESLFRLRGLALGDDMYDAEKRET